MAGPLEENELRRYETAVTGVVFQLARRRAVPAPGHDLAAHRDHRRTWGSLHPGLIGYVIVSWQPGPS